MKEIDWTKVPVNAKLLVSYDKEHWIRRRFAKYENHNVYVFVDGCDSYTSKNISKKHRFESWTFVKLIGEEHK